MAWNVQISTKKNRGVVYKGIPFLKAMGFRWDEFLYLGWNWEKNALDKRGKIKKNLKPKRNIFEGGNNRLQPKFCNIRTELINFLLWFLAALWSWKTKIRIENIIKRNYVKFKLKWQTEVLEQIIHAGGWCSNWVDQGMSHVRNRIVCKRRKYYAMNILALKKISNLCNLGDNSERVKNSKITYWFFLGRPQKNTAMTAGDDLVLEEMGMLKLLMAASYKNSSVWRPGCFWAKINRRKFETEVGTPILPTLTRWGR